MGRHHDSTYVLPVLLSVSVTQSVIETGLVEENVNTQDNATCETCFSILSNLFGKCAAICTPGGKYSGSVASNSMLLRSQTSNR